MRRERALGFRGKTMMTVIIVAGIIAPVFSSISQPPSNKAFFQAFMGFCVECKITKSSTSSVSPELLQSWAYICSRISPFAREGLFREPLYFVKKPYIAIGLQTIFCNISHSWLNNLMLLGENWLCSELARKHHSLRAASKPKNVITLEKPRK